jgi:hypothetical protein
MRWIALAAALALAAHIGLGCDQRSGSATQSSEVVQTQRRDPLEPILPASIAELRAQFRGKSPHEVAAIIVQRLGPPARDVGSGVEGLQWDVDGGVLYLCAAPAGPPVFYGSNGIPIWLIDTENSIGDNIVNDFEMDPLPNLKYDEIQFWGGDLELRRDGNYKFVPAEFRFFVRNFFARFPHGKYTVQYPKGLSPSTLLESLADKTCVATIHFTPDSWPNTTQPANSTDLKLYSSRNGWLRFSSSDGMPLDYTLYGFWQHVWGKSTTFKWDYSFPEPLNLRSGMPGDPR